MTQTVATRLFSEASRQISWVHEKYLGFKLHGEKWKNRIIMPLRGDLNGSGVPWDGQEATLLPTLLAKFEKQQHLHSSSPHLPPLHDGDDNRILQHHDLYHISNLSCGKFSTHIQNSRSAATSEQPQTSSLNQNAIKHVSYLIPQCYGKPTLVWIT